MNNGHVDFISSPLDVRKLTNTSQCEYEPIFAQSASMKKAMKVVAQVSPLRAVALIYGESGTGKSFLAHKIHQLSGNASGPFVDVNCQGVDEDTLRLKIFGDATKRDSRQDKISAGLLGVANGGSLLLRNVDHLSLSIQWQILKAIQEKSYVPIGGKHRIQSNARIMATMKPIPEHLLGEDRIRPDFYYRITVFPIRMGSLRERKDDFAQLATFFINQFKQKKRVRPVSISDHALFMLASYSWPDNVAELRKIMAQVAAKLDPTDDVVLMKHLPSKISLLHERERLSRISSLYLPCVYFSQDRNKLTKGQDGRLGVRDEVSLIRRAMAILTKITRHLRLSRRIEGRISVECMQPVG